jgi:hypothetical protein
MLEEKKCIRKTLLFPFFSTEKPCMLSNFSQKRVIYHILKSSTGRNIIDLDHLQYDKLIIDINGSDRRITGRCFSPN